MAKPTPTHRKRSFHRRSRFISQSELRTLCMPVGPRSSNRGGRGGPPSEAACASVVQTSSRSVGLRGEHSLRPGLDFRVHDSPFRDRDAAANRSNSERSDGAGDPADEEIAPYDRPRFEVELGAVPRARDRGWADPPLIEGSLSVSAPCLEAVQSTLHIENCHEAPVHHHPHRRSGRRNGSRRDGFGTCTVAESPVLSRRSLAP
jgi:hypothetical protein